MVLFVSLKAVPFVVTCPSRPSCRLGAFFSLALYSTKFRLVVPFEAIDVSPCPDQIVYPIYSPVSVWHDGSRIYPSLDRRVLWGWYFSGEHMQRSR